MYLAFLKVSVKTSETERAISQVQCIDSQTALGLRYRESLGVVQKYHFHGDSIPELSSHFPPSAGVSSWVCNADI